MESVFENWAHDLKLFYFYTAFKKFRWEVEIGFLLKILWESQPCTHFLKARSVLISLTYALKIIFIIIVCFTWETDILTYEEYNFSKRIFIQEKLLQDAWNLIILSVRCGNRFDAVIGSMWWSVQIKTFFGQDSRSKDGINLFKNICKKKIIN